MIFKNLEKMTFMLMSIIFLAGSLLAIYHVGIERGLISESFVCGNNINASITDKSEILKQLQNKAISCKDVTFTIIGASLASINTFISISSHRFNIYGYHKHFIVGNSIKTNILI